MKDPREISRADAARIGNDTLLISELGEYVTSSGTRVVIAQDVQTAIDASVSYAPDDGIPLPSMRVEENNGVVEVWSMSTLEAARRLHNRGLRTAALNFASARNPGGGFRSGARAQEESLCRSSALFVCLRNQPMYEFNRRNSDLLYSSWALYSPDVPVFRSDDGTLLETPWLCSFISCPAPNTREVTQRDRGRGADIEEAMRERIERVLSIAALQGVEGLVLGAWGCGAFGGDAEMVSRLFHNAFTGMFRGIFTTVVFAILDTRESQSNLGPFETRFGKAVRNPA